MPARNQRNRQLALAVADLTAAVGFWPLWTRPMFDINLAIDADLSGFDSIRMRALTGEANRSLFYEAQHVAPVKYKLSHQVRHHRAVDLDLARDVPK